MGQMAGQIDDLEAEANLKKTEAIISSMTPEERQNPDIIREDAVIELRMGQVFPILMLTVF